MKKKGKMTPIGWNWKVILTQEKESKKKKKKILKHQIIYPFHCSTVLISFCLVPHLTPILQYFSFLISIIIFTINDNFCSILLLNDVRDIANFTIYILQIGMSPITNSYWLYCLINTNHIFTTSVCKLFVVNFVITMNWLFLFIYFNDMKYIYFLIIFYLFLLWLSINIF